MAGGWSIFPTFLYLYLCNTGAMIVRVLMASALFALQLSYAFYVTRINISFTTITKVWHSVNLRANVQQNYMQISYTEFHKNRTINLEGRVINLSLPFGKVRFSPSLLSRNSQLLHKCLLMPSITVFFFKINFHLLL